MKILVVSTSVVPLGTQKYGGIEKMCLDWIIALAKAGHEVTGAAPWSSKVPENIKLIKTVQLPEEQDRDDIAEKRIIDAGIGQIDVIHDFSHRHIFKDKRLPTIHMIWDPITIHYDFKADNKCVCVSQWQADRYEKMYGRKAIVMPPWVDIEVFKPISNPTRERYLFLGKLTVEKGAHIAIRHAKEGEVPLDVVGGLIPSDSHDYLEYLKKQCNGRIRLLYNVTEEEKISLLQNAKGVLYFPQQLEAHCLVGMESWACNTEFIVDDEGPLLEIFEHVLNPREEAVKRWSLENVLPQWLKLYQEVSEGRTW